MLKRKLKALGLYIRNRAKPIKGAIAAAITYVAAEVGLDLDPELAAIISGVVFAAVVERVGPIFGWDVASPQVAHLDDQPVVDLDVRGE